MTTMEFCPFCGAQKILYGETRDLGCCQACYRFFGVTEYEEWDYEYVNQKLAVLKSVAANLKNASEEDE